MKVLTKSNVQFENIFIKDNIDKSNKSMLLTDLLDEYIYETYNKSEDHRNDAYGEKLERYFHPSQLGKAFCARKLVYEFLEAPFNEDLKFYSALTHRVFHNGAYTHKRIQSYLADLDSFTKGKCKLIGRWRCVCGAVYGYAKEGKKENEFWVPRPKKCKKCGVDGRAMEYKEAGIFLPDLRIKGKMDGVLEWKDEQWIIEIKSINQYQFQSLKNPPDYYIPQSDIYMMGSGIHKVIWLFEDKSSQNIREFITFHNIKNIESIIKLLVKVNKCIDEKKLPKRIEDKKLCKPCEYRGFCANEYTYEFIEKKKYLDEVGL